MYGTRVATCIVGGGLFGLALGFQLKRAGEPVQIFEAGPRAGGVLETVEERGFQTESAANAFLDREPALTRLIDALALGDQVRRAEASSAVRFVFTRGKLRKLPVSPAGFLGSDVLPLGARLRVLMEPFSWRPTELHDESLASFMRRHIGERATRVLADAFQTGIYAGDIDALSAPAVFPKLVEAERTHRSLFRGLAKQRKASPPQGSGKMCSFEGGMETLPRAIAGQLGSALHLNRRVAQLTRSPPRWTLRFDDGTTRDCERLVLAIPSYAAAPLLRPHDEALANELDRIDYAPIAAVHLGFPSGVVAVPDALGFLVPAEEKRTILGALFISKLFPPKAPGQELVTVLAGGALRPELLALGDDELIERVLADLRAALGSVPSPLYTRVVRWPRAIAQYNVGHLDRMLRIDAAAAKLPGLVLAGTSYRGVGITEVAKNAEALAALLAARDV